MKKNLLASVVLFSAMSTIVRAGEDKDAKAIQAPADPSSSRWSLSAGVSLSSIKTTFRADPGLNQALSGNFGGSNAFYTNGASVVYGDGTVGLDTGNGTTGFTGGHHHHRGRGTSMMPPSTSSKPHP